MFIFWGGKNTLFLICSTCSFQVFFNNVITHLRLSVFGVYEKEMAPVKVPFFIQ